MLHHTLRKSTLEAVRAGAFPPLAVLLTIAACGAEVPIEPAIMAQRAALLARNAGLQTAVGTGFAGAPDSTLRQLSASVDGVLEELKTALPSPAPSPVLDILGKNSFIRALLDSRSGERLDEKLNALSVQLERWVKERLLAQANLESKTEDSAIYRLRPDPTCRPLVAPGAPEPAVEADCQRELERLEVRVLMKALLDGISLRFVVGPQKLEFSNITLRLDGLDWRADLGASSLATDYVNATLGEGTSSTARFRKLAGKTLVSVRKDTPTGVSLTVTVTDPVEVIRWDGKRDTGIFRVAAALDPILTITGEGATQTLLAQVALPATEVHGVWDPGRKGAVNTDLKSAFTSFSARVRVNESGRELLASDLRLVDYVESIKGTPTLRLTVGAGMAGALLDVRAKAPGPSSLAGAAGEVVTVELPQGMDVSAELRTSGLAGDFPANARPFLPDETFRLQVKGMGRLGLIPQRGLFAGVEVGAGAVAISSTGAKAPVDVPTGKCLTRARTVAPDGHPLLRLLAVVECPPKPPTGGTR